MGRIQLDIMNSGVKELDDFVFTNKIMKNLKNGTV